MTDEVRVSDKEGKAYTITGIPSDLMDKVQKAAAAMYPDENPADAWMHLVLDTFLSVTSADESVIQMTGIPPSALDALNARCAEIGYGQEGDVVGGSYGLLSVILQAADSNMLEIGRLHTTESQPASSITAIIVGIPTKAWEAIAFIAQQASQNTHSAERFFGNNEPSAMSFLMGLLEQAHKQQLTFQAVAPTTTTKPTVKSVAGRGVYSGVKK